MAPNLELIVTELIEDLIKTHKRLLKFLMMLKDLPNNQPLRIAVDDFINEYLQITPTQQDPYQLMAVAGDPFVDRREFRKKLRDFFHSLFDRVFVTHGPRESGRSYKYGFIQNAARHEGMISIYIDLLNSSIDEVIMQLRSAMKLPADELRDIKAQDATKVKGLIAVLKGQSPAFVENLQKWCIILDHHDRSEIKKDLREFTELLLMEVRQRTIENTFVIVLGHSDWQHIPATVYNKFVSLPTKPLLQNDFADFIQEIELSNNGLPLTQEQLNAHMESVFKDVSLPLNLTGLITVNERLRGFIQ